MANKTDVKDTLSNGNIPFLLRKMAIPGVLSIILSGLILTVVMYAYAEPIMYFLGASSTSIDAAVTYMRIYTLGAAAIMGYDMLLI